MVYLNSLSYSRQTSNERRRTEHYHMKNKEKIDESHKSQLKFEYKIYILNKCIQKTVVYTRVNGALHIENCKNYKKVITHQHIA